MSKVCNQCNISLPLENFRKGHNQCKKCTSIKSKCEHNKYRQTCKVCKGGSICQHSKIRSRCKECEGGSICCHSKLKYRCSECGGSDMCEHKKRKSDCKECKGSNICIHNKRKTDCKECKGSQICEHQRTRSYCKDCKGSQLCCHNKFKQSCKDCKGSGICIHDKHKRACVICTPSCACKECKSIYVSKKCTSYPLCQACFCNKYPDHEKSTLYKIKERYLRDELRLRFPDKDINMVFDKTVDGGCSKKRPDVLIDLLLYSIIIECDEEQHKNYECENKRTMQLFEDLGNRPLILIRFNPDGYIENNKKVEGCFTPLIKIEDIHKKKFYDLNEKEWKRRVDILEKVIREKIREDIPEKEVDEIKLFYDVYGECHH